MENPSQVVIEGMIEDIMRKISDLPTTAANVQLYNYAFPRACAALEAVKQLVAEIDKNGGSVR